MKKSILIVGGTGFIGHNLLKKLSKSNYTLSSISTKKPINKKKIKGVNYIALDISKKKELSKLKNLEFDTLINLGGYIDHSKKKKTFDSHYIGTKNLINYFKEKNLKKFIQIGSSLEYGNQKSPQKENLECKPRGNYGLAKYKASKFLNEIKNINFTYMILRLYQIYGPYQDKTRLIPYVISSCLKNKKFDCTDGNQLRDFLFVDDLVELFLKILKFKKLDNTVVNVGSGKKISVRFLINKIKKIVKSGKPIFGKIKMRKDEIKILYADIYKARSKFKWNPKINLTKGIAKTINYYERN